MRSCTIRVAKTKALISFAVTAKLVCAFVFAYADCWFSYAVAHISFLSNVFNTFQTQYLLFFHFHFVTTPQRLKESLISIPLPAY